MNKKPKLADYKQHLSNIFQQATGISGWNTNYVPKSIKPADTTYNKIKSIAFYLPQFHQIPENDKWWGKGFTEWTNVSKATPQFLNHYQPHLPGELGFYDLRNPESIKSQAELARHYGIYGFCFHHYWFNGTKLLSRPLQTLLANPDIDINFCVCWANENWTKKWDGLDNEILIEQKYSPEDDIAFIDDLIPAFSDSRYIKVAGKPVLIVYRTSLLPDPKATAKRWRQRVKEHGFSGIHLVAATSFEIHGSNDFSFDASVEFPPHKLKPKVVTSEVTVINPNYSGTVYDYPSSVKTAKRLKFNSKTHYRTVMPSWDNEARRPANGFSFINSSPKEYSEWLEWACSQTLSNRNAERFVFINAWNEWAEGAHLEPDRKYGYAYLHATSAVLSKFTYTTPIEKLARKIQSRFIKNSDLCVAVYLYYWDLSDDLINHIKEIPSCDVHLSVTKDTPLSVIDKWQKSGINFSLAITENKGRDILPFLDAFHKFIKPNKYKLFCKVHTKKSLHRPDGDDWRGKIYKELFCHKEALLIFNGNKKVGMVAPEHSLTDLSIKEIHLGNIFWLDAIFKKLHAEDMIGTYNTVFPAGSMFWGRTSAFSKLDLLKPIQSRFEPEVGQLDGTLAHAFERVFGFLVLAKDYTIDTVSDKINRP